MDLSDPFTGCLTHSTITRYYGGNLNVYLAYPILCGGQSIDKSRFPLPRRRGCTRSPAPQGRLRQSGGNKVPVIDSVCTQEPVPPTTALHGCQGGKCV